MKIIVNSQEEKLILADFLDIVDSWFDHDLFDGAQFYEVCDKLFELHKSMDVEEEGRDRYYKFIFRFLALFKNSKNIQVKDN